MEQKDAYWEMQKKQLRKIGAQIEALESREQEEGREPLRDEDLEALRAMMEEALKKADALKVASENAWADLKTGVETTVSDLKKAVENAVGEFGADKKG
jgi:hypothetical protein